jgi:DNA-binding NtrC family response regulator
VYPLCRFAGFAALFRSRSIGEHSGPRLAYPLQMNYGVQTAAILTARRNLTVCVVDGDPSQMAFIRDSLGRAGFPAVGTANSEEALEKVRLGNCRVIVADCKLPGLDGLAFLEKVLHQDLGMRVILMSATHSVDSAIEAIKHGAYDYVCKPLDYRRLTKTLDDLAEQLRKLQNSATALNGDWRPLPLSEVRSMHIQRVLEKCNGNRVRAARMLGIGRTSLYRFLKSAHGESTVRARA